MQASALYRYSIFLLKLSADILGVGFSYALAYYIKFKIVTYNPAMSGTRYAGALSFIIIIWLFSFSLVKLYQERKGILPEVDEAIAVFKGVTIGTILITAFSFFYKDFPESRWVVTIAWAIGFGVITLFRLIILSFIKVLKKRGFGTRQALIIGANDLGQSIATKMLCDPILGYSYVGSLSNEPPEEISFFMRDKLKILGHTAQFKAIQAQYQIKAIFLALPKLDSRDILEIATFCDEQNISFQTVPNLFELMASSVNVDDLDGIPILSFKESPLTPLQSVLKRLFDILVASLALIVLSPLLLIIYLAVKLTSSGPAIYKQVRTGLDGKPFDFYKFRSMRVDAELNSGPIHAQDKNDPRVTPIGKFLRHSSLDELPQLLNVLKGDMSLVGPRPERPFFVDKFSSEIPNFMARHKIRGGITGWAQVNGRAELTVRPEEKLRYDLYYIENWSLVFDLKIILKTFLQVMRREHVY